MKKLLSLFLALAMLFSMTACTEEPDSSEETTEPEVSTTDTAPTDPATKTIYLPTLQTSISQALHSTTEITYDEVGRLIGYRITRTYPSMDTTSDISLAYEYADHGIRQIILSTAGESVPLVADYQGEQLMGYFGEVDGQHSGWRFAYNSDGRIATVYLAENEYEKEVLSLDYYDSGALRERVVHDQAYQITTKYNQNGKITEQSAYDPVASTFLYRNFYEYDAQGNQVRQETYSMGSTEPNSIIQMKYDADGRCIEINASGNGQSAQATGEWDAATRTMSFSLDVGGMEAVMLHAYDDAGHVIRNCTQSGDMVVQENTVDYVAMELPADYEEPDLQDPVYLLFALGIT